MCIRVVHRLYSSLSFLYPTYSFLLCPLLICSSSATRTFLLKTTCDSIWEGPTWCPWGSLGQSYNSPNIMIETQAVSTIRLCVDNVGTSANNWTMFQTILVQRVYNAVYIYSSVALPKILLIARNNPKSGSLRTNEYFMEWPV